MPDLEDLQPGRFVAALYITETEKLWSRAEVISRDGVSKEKEKEVIIRDLISKKQVFVSREWVKKNTSLHQEGKSESRKSKWNVMQWKK